jgi:hypothetical protein
MVGVVFLIAKKIYRAARHTFRCAATLGAVCVVSVLLIPSLALAQVTLRSQISPESGSIDDLFLFTVTLEGPQDRITPQLATGNDFEIQLLGPKTSVSIMNGVVRSQQSYIYQLTPKRTGTLKTPEVQAEVQGQLLSAPPITVVIRNTQAQAPQAPSGDRTKESVFVTQVATPTKAYVGQQIVNSITVYHRVNLQGVQIDDETSDGFWQETISDGSNSRRDINGQEYAAVEISRALFPLRAGSLTIPQRKGIARVPVVKRNPLSGLDPFSDDFFDNFFQRTIIQEKKISSNEISIEVKPLPATPTEISQFIKGLPIVGTTSLSLQYSDSAIRVGESKNVSLVVTSEGNLNPLKSLPLQTPSGVKIYDGQTQTKHDTRGERLSTQKTFTFSIVPLQPGMLRIPGASLAYFDPATDSYKLTTTPDITLVVTGQAQNPQGVGNSAAQPALALTPAPATSQNSLVPTLAPIPAAPALSYQEKTVWEEIGERVSVQLALLLLTAAILLVALVGFVIKARSHAAPQRRLAAQIAKSDTLTEFEECLRSWAEQALSGARATSTFDELRSIARAKGKDSGAQLALLALLDDVEIARYGSDARAPNAAQIVDLKKRLTSIMRGWQA